MRDSPNLPSGGSEDGELEVGTLRVGVVAGEEEGILTRGLWCCRAAATAAGWRNRTSWTQLGGK